MGSIKTVIENSLMIDQFKERFLTESTPLRVPKNSRQSLQEALSKAITISHLSTSLLIYLQLKHVMMLIIFFKGQVVVLGLIILIMFLIKESRA